MMACLVTVHEGVVKVCKLILKATGVTATDDTFCDIIISPA